jgi:hypothetical protein
VPLSQEKIDRAKEALIAFNNVREQYSDVLVVLDYVTITDVAKYESDSDDGQIAGNELDEDELLAVLWRLGKHIGTSETSHHLLPSHIRFALDEHERKKAQE